MTKTWNSCPKNLQIGSGFQGFLLNWLEICSKCVLEINVFWGFCYASKLALETLWKTRSLAFWKSVNNGRSSKFSLASKQHKKRFETHLFSSLVYYCQARPSVEINGAHSIKNVFTKNNMWKQGKNLSFDCLQTLRWSRFAKKFYLSCNRRVERRVSWLRSMSKSFQSPDSLYFWTPFSSGNP